jgi:hypothetical protein
MNSQQEIDDYDFVNSEALPIPISIAKTNFKQFDSSKIDDFLYSNHRYTSIDVLIKELSQLSLSLNQTLLDLVNHDYNDFISLGKSINNSHDKIDAILNDVSEFTTELTTISSTFDETIDQIANILTQRNVIVKIKTLTKVSLMLNDQIENFENALEKSVDYDLKQLTGFYLSITNLFNFLTTSSNISNCNNNPWITNYLRHKIASLKLEFLSHLQNLTKTALREKDGDTILLLVNIYKLLGHESDMLRILSTK